MRPHAKLFAIVCILVTPLAAGTQHDQGQDSSCVVIQQALTDCQRIKVGITRGEVEKYFAQEGGAQLPPNTRYVYPKCRYLHVDVEFTPKGPPEHLFSREDIVMTVSKLYVEYEAKD